MTGLCTLPRVSTGGALSRSGTKKPCLSFQRLLLPAAPTRAPALSHLAGRTANRCRSAAVPRHRPPHPSSYPS